MRVCVCARARVLAITHASQILMRVWLKYLYKKKFFFKDCICYDLFIYVMILFSRDLHVNNSTLKQEDYNDEDKCKPL